MSRRARSSPGTNDDAVVPHNIVRHAMTCTAGSPQPTNHMERRPHLTGRTAKLEPSFGGLCTQSLLTQVAPCRSSSFASTVRRQCREQLTVTNDTGRRTGVLQLRSRRQFLYVVGGAGIASAAGCAYGRAAGLQDTVPHRLLQGGGVLRKFATPATEVSSHESARVFEHS